MKRIIIILSALLLFNGFVYAKQFNSSVYKPMYAQSYRNNYNRQINQPIPYWQAQSNYATRNRYYSNYQNSLLFNNSVNQYNYNTRMMRGSYR